MPATDYDSLTDTEIRTRLSAVGYDLPISINRDFLIRKLQQAEEGSRNSSSGNNGTPGNKKRLSLNVASPSPVAPATNRRLARNSMAANHNHQPVTPPGTRSHHATATPPPLTPPRGRKQTPPRQVTKPSVPAPTTPSSQTRATTNQLAQKIPFTNRYVNVDESDEDNQFDGDVEPASPPPLFTTSRKSTSLKVHATSKPAVPPTTNTDKMQKYMKLFNSENRASLSYSRSSSSGINRSGGRFSSDDDDDSDQDRSPVRAKVVIRDSAWHKIKDRAVNNVPNVLLTVILTFFILVVAIYLFNKLQNTSMDTLAVVDNDGKKLDTYLPVCGGGNAAEHGACIPDDFIFDTKKLFGELRNELNERRRLIDCKSPEDELASDNLNLAKTKTLLYRLSALNKPRIDSTFQYLLHFIIENPKLGLTVETELWNGTRAQLSKPGEITGAEAELYITTTSNDRAWYCSIFKTIWNTISYLTLIAVVGFITFGIYQIYMTVQNKKKESKRQVFSVIEDILSLLQEHHENSQGSNDEPLAIHHLRDNLIPPAERTPEKMKIWDEAINYILSNESRVREEMHHIRGEEYRVLKWLPTVSPKRPNSPVGGWQGQAFEIVEGSPNSLPLKIPTNCLKVRHMYDSKSPLTEELKNKIETSLNCKAGIRFQHIGYDNHNDSCVYLKCFTKEDAKTAYVNIHGWWYNGKLLSVKFLREQRYHTRFPESVDN